MHAQEQERKPGKLSGILYRFRFLGFTLIVIAIFFIAFFFIKSSTNSAYTFWGAVLTVLTVFLTAIQIIPIVFAHKTVIKHRTENGNATESVFLFNKPHLPALEEFFGRERERTILLSRAHQGGSTSIIGPRRIGKTWLIDYLKLSIATESGTAFQVASLDGSMPDCKTEANFTAKALEALGVPAAFLANQQNMGLSGLGQYVKDLKSKNLTPLLCIDEFEGFFHHQAFDCDFYAGLRNIAQNDGLILVIASQRPLIDLIGERCETSGFFNIFHQLILKPFSQEEAARFARVKGTQAGFTADECTYLLKYGREGNGKQEGWPPMRLQLAGNMLLTDKDLTRSGKSHDYRLDDTAYWHEFEERLEGTYRGAVR